MRIETVQKWGLFEADFVVSSDALGAKDPWREVFFTASFVHDESGESFQSEGFYDGNGHFCIRFMPNQMGIWRYRTESKLPALAGVEGAFICTAPQPGNRGNVKIRADFHFVYDNGDPYFPFGTTCYAWTHQTEELQEQTLATLRKAPFNKVRMCIFPKDYIYNENEPSRFPFVRDDSGAFNFTKFDPRFWRHLEQRITDLCDLDIQADLILFHPYDRWGFADMSREEDFHYLRYVTARLSAFRNLWWSMANEYDFMLDSKPMEHWDALFTVLQEGDPYRRLQSIHNGNPAKAYDHSQSWISHVSMQDSNIRQSQAWRERYGKPIINDELQYEGNIPKQWGNISGRELVHRIWWMVVNGCYASHGETFLHPDDILWWAKGGVLHGESPARIAFLRRIIEEDVKVGLAPFGLREPWHSIAGGHEGDYRLIYFAEHQPAIWSVGITEEPNANPDDFIIEIIDPWEMTITPAEICPPPYLPTPRGVKPMAATPFAVRLPGRPNLALRVKRKA
jgi:hypothetical protein